MEYWLIGKPGLQMYNSYFKMKIISYSVNYENFSENCITHYSYFMRNFGITNILSCIDSLLKIGDSGANKN